MKKYSKAWFSALAALFLCAGTPAVAGQGQGRPPGAGPGQQRPPTSTGRPTLPPAGQQQGAPGNTRGSETRGRPDANTNSAKKSTGELLAQNTKLSSRVESLFPAGTNLQEAAGGFKNLGQFVAAAHVSKNLDIPFAQIKTKMMGGANLGKAIRELKPEVDAKAEARKAEQQAKRELKDSGA